MGSPPIVPSVTEGTLGGEPPSRLIHHGNAQRFLDTRRHPRHRLDYRVMIRALIYAAALYLGLIGAYRIAHAETQPATSVFIGDAVSTSGYWNTCAGPLVRPVVDSFIGQSFATVEAAASQLDAALPDSDSCVGAAHASTISVAKSGTNAVTVGYRRNADGMAMYWTLSFRPGYSCPDGWTLNGQICERQSCPTGTLSTGRYLMNSGPSSSFCSGGCYVSFTGVWPSHTDGTNLYGEGSLEYSGDYVGECSGSDVPPSGGSSAQPSTPPDQQGECSSGNSVTINGTTTCMPGDTGTGDGDDAGEGDGSGDGDDTGEDDGTGDGDDAGEDDGTGEDDTGDDDGTEDDFCAKNPDVSICKDRTSSGDCESFQCSGDAIDCSIARAAWEQACRGRKRSLTDSGDCETMPSCEGDAIDCAIAKFSWKAKCTWDWATKTNDFSDEFSRAKADMGNPDALITEDSSSVFSYQSHISGPAQCPAAISIPVFGHVVTAPTDWVCGYLGVIAIVLKIAAWLIVGRMVLGAF